MIAPPIPCPPRDSMSISGFWASPHSNEPAVKMTSPTTNNKRRPKRSASDPAVNNNDARLSA